MISVRSRDGSKGLGFCLSIGGVGRKMEDAELEEGEAYSYQDNEDSDVRIDPDVALSYIDEKLQDVLGHFQKDFEGGVSAENLGAKFGGYGSFLPTTAYHRSPVWSHPRTPPKVQNHTVLRSPNTLQLGLNTGDGHNSLVSSVIPQSGRFGPSSSRSSLPVTKGPTGNGSMKQEVIESFIHAESLKHASGKKKIDCSSDQKTLKVRIKVGSDNLSSCKNAAIYSGLGLDVSPSSSLDDAPSGSEEGMCQEWQHNPFESPTSILLIMTSFPIQGGPLLSPLPDDLIHLSEKERHSNDAKSLLDSRSGWENVGVLGSGNEVSRRSGKVFLEKKLKPIKGSDVSSESKTKSNKAYQDKGVVILKREPEIDIVACEELVSNTLKLPLLSNLCSGSAEKTNGAGRTGDSLGKVNKVMAQDVMSIERVKEEPLEPSSVRDGRKQKNGTATKVWENKNDSPINEITTFTKTEAYQKEGKTYESGNVNSKGKKFKHDELTNPLKKKPDEKVTSKEHDNMATPVKENVHPEVKNKLKGSPNHGNLAGNASSESLRINFSLESKVNDRAKVMNVQPEFESEHVKAQRDLDKNKDRYRDFFGELDEEENQVNCLEMPSEGRPKSIDLIKKGIAITNGSLKSRTNVDENGKPLELDGNPTTSNVARRSGTGPILDGALYTTDSVALEDFWVCCDTCQTWRLLPFGIYPKNLPEKWICNMLDWLPGMNRCSFSEEETTKALMAHRQAAASAIVTQGNTGHVQDLLQNHPNYDLHIIPNGGKKKNGAKEITAGMVKAGASQLSNSTKKKSQTSTKSRSLNDMNQSPLGSENGYPHLDLSNDTPMEKHKSKHKEIQKLHLHSGGEDAKITKMKSKRDLDQDFSKASKKLKSKGMDFIGDDRTSDHSGTIIKLGHGSRTADLNASGGNEQHRQTDQSSKDSKYESKKRQQAFVRKASDEALLSINNGSLDIVDGEGKDMMKKRKVKESLETRDFTKLDESDYIKEKKAKIFKPEGKESSTSKGSGRHKKKGNQIENQKLRQHVGSNLSQRSLDDVDSLKRDIGSIHASIAATSSSSKVSGSCKTKSSFEVKGSPVESVSSSPMRISNQNNLHPCRNLTGKDVSEDVVFFATNSPVRCSDGDDDGRSDQSRTRRKDKPSSVLHRDSLDSSLLHFREQDAVHGRGSKSRIKVVPSPDMNNRRINGGLDNQGITISPGERVAHPYPDESRENNTHSQTNEFHSIRSGKGSSSRLKDESRSSNPDYYKDKIDTQNSLNELQQSLPPFGDGGKNESKKFGFRPEKAENKSVKKNSSRISSNENGAATQLNLEERECLDVRVNAATYRKDEMVYSKQNQLQGCNGEKSLNRNLSERTDQVEMDNGRGQSLPLHTTGDGQNETTIVCPRPIGGLQKGNTVDILLGDASESNGVLKSQKQIKKADHQNGVHSTRHPTPNGRRASDNPSPARRDSSNQAATNVLKEAKDLKHLADRLKNSGSNHEGTGMYFEAALKFLNGASLLESCNNGSKQSEMIQSMQIYSSTAKLCEFCAIEYEKSKDMAAAALAYKCMEVAYMRVVYSSHNNASRDRHELQTALHIVPPGESPSSSASDVDNLNNPSTVDKATLHKGVSSPQVAGSHVITAKNRPSFVRLLNYAQDVNFAMEASRKSRIAFSAASEGAKIGDNILVFKRALDFNFHDVDGLLHLVRLAMESIGR